VNKCGDLAFIDIKVNAGPLAESVHKVKKDDHILHHVGDESAVIRIPLVGKMQAARGDVSPYVRRGAIA
jgi:hypothetical protein